MCRRSKEELIPVRQSNDLALPDVSENNGIKKKGSGCLNHCPFHRLNPERTDTVPYFLTSAFTSALPPSGTSTSISTWPALGCQARILCFPAGTSLISNVPSSFTTA